MDQNGLKNGNHKTNNELKVEIKRELLKHFKSVDDDLIAYILGKFFVAFFLTINSKKKKNVFFITILEVVDLNKEDFISISDVYDALGGILGELGEKSDADINGICRKFYDIVKW
jgi:hypothetical protein